MRITNPNDLQALRLKRRLTIKAVALLSGVDPATISRIERRKNSPKPETLVALARALKVDAGRLARMVKQP